MNLPASQRWLWVAVALALPSASCCSADPPAAPSGPTLGSGADPAGRQAVVIEGNASFSAAEILEALGFHLDVQVAAHGLARPEDYISLLARKITLGYRHGGFPEARVTATADTNTRRILVKVTEGPRFGCGAIVFSGTPAMTNAAVTQKIRERLLADEPVKPKSGDRFLGLDLGSNQSAKPNSALWRTNGPAHFDGPAQQKLLSAVEQVLEELNYYQPKVSVGIRPDPARRLADLNIDFADEGIQGTIERIEVSGLGRNTRDAVLGYLQLQPGIRPYPSLITNLTRALGSSGRFLHHDVSLAPQKESGKFTLQIDLEELPGARPLNEDLTATEQALLRFGQWLDRWKERPEDVVCAVSSGEPRLRFDAVLSPAGLALAVRDDFSNSPPALSYAVVAAEDQMGLYAVSRRRKLVFPPANAGALGYVRIEPAPKSRARNPFNLSVGLGFRSRDEANPVLPFDFRVEVPPAALVHEANRRDRIWSLQDGVLRLHTTNLTDGAQSELEIDAATGRLIQLHVRAGSMSVRLRAEKGAFDRLSREIAAVTISHPNDLVPNHGLSSGLAFVLTDLMHSPSLSRWLESRASVAATNALPGWSSMAEIRTVLGGLLYALPQQDLARAFQPLDELMSPLRDTEEAERFFVPLEDAASISSSSSGLGVMLAYLLSHLEDLWAPDTWPWTLMRDTAVSMAGQGLRTGTEFESLLRSEQMGPVGYLATARLLGRADARRARAFAERGLSRLTLPEFRKDYQGLFAGETLSGRMLANLLELLGKADPAQFSVLTAHLSPDAAGFLQRLANCAREAKEVPVAVASWPAWEQHWAAVVRPWLERSLSRFLPQVQFLTAPEALYARGQTLTEPGAPLQDFEEAAQCFRKAAEQGHGPSRFCLGRLYEQGKGVPQDFKEAMRCYRLALDQRVPHASCALAALYRDGRGVERSLAEAAKWYRLEAEGTCPRAQFNLGRIYAQQSQYAEAVKWYRRAAEQGQTDAQVQLGELLTDGLSVPPDYVEACEWLLLATQKEDNRVVELQLRRVKARLTPAQLEEAQRRADAVAERPEPPSADPTP